MNFNWIKKMLPPRLPNAFLIGIFTLLVVTGSYAFGYKNGSGNPQTISVKGVANISDAAIETDFSTFWEAWQDLKNLHIHGAEAKDKDFLYGAIQGLVASLKDPNTIYFPPEEAKKFAEDIQGHFGGIGAEIGMKENQLVVITPIKGSPAEKAGLKSGDEILKINGQDTSQLGVGDAVKHIRGEVGTAVVLNIFRESWQEPKDISILRDEIKAPTVDYKVEEHSGKKILNIKLYTFNATAGDAFYEAAVNGILNRVDGIVFDLRGDPGGYLEIAVNIAGWFLKKGDIVAIEHFRPDAGPDRVFRANGNNAFGKTPVVILVNQGSASASEILAGALRDDRNAKIIGEKSFGKGTVQELRDLKEGTLKVTVAQWLLPSGHTIEKNGLDPDFVVKPDEAGKKDTQYEKALEVLLGEIVK